MFKLDIDLLNIKLIKLLKRQDKEFSFCDNELDSFNDKERDLLSRFMNIERENKNIYEISLKNVV